MFLVISAEIFYIKDILKDKIEKFIYIGMF